MTSLRERKKARTRHALGEAATRLFVAKGFDQVTVEDIVAEAGVSRRTFFRYFATKEAAFFAGQEDRRDRLVAGVAERRARGEGLSAGQAVREVLVELASEYMHDVEGALRWHRELHASAALRAEDLRLDAEWEATIVGLLRSAGSEELMARVEAGALMGVVRAVLGYWHEHRGEEDLRVLGREAFATLDAGLGR